MVLFITLDKLAPHGRQADLESLEQEGRKCSRLQTRRLEDYNIRVKDNEFHLGCSLSLCEHIPLCIPVHMEMCLYEYLYLTSLETGAQVRYISHPFA